MAFEVEHAEAFAFSAKNPRKHREHHDRSRPSASNQKQVTLGAIKSEDNATYIRGYLHTYRAHRNLNLLYVDGMSAGKSNMGTLDTQDLILRENKTSGAWGPFMDELERAESICDMLTELGYDGLVRMEIGFEVIYCNFTKGVDLVMQTRSAINDDEGIVSNMNPFQWARAAAERYDGIGGDRAILDFSSMVSAYFFPVNTTNTDPDRPDLHRLAGANLDDLKDIKTYLKRLLEGPRRFTVKWQAVVDIIVARYRHRLALLAAPDQSFESFSTELRLATQMYINAPALPGDITLQGKASDNGTMEALQACRQHYLLSTYLEQDFWSLEDQLIHTSIHKVTSRICEALFAAREIITRDNDDQTNLIMKSSGEDMNLGKLTAARKHFTDLKRDLAWTVWRRPQICAVDEVLLTVMWPMGSEEDYWNPGCRTREQVKFARRGYWKSDVEFDDLR
jgi:hypothetical protein